MAAIVKREEPNCGLCGEPIDGSLPKDHPRSYNCDHIISPKVRPDLAEVRSNLRASHRECNRDRERARPRVGDKLIISIDEF